MKNSLMEQIYKLYNMNRTQFSKFSEINYKTLESWETNGISKQGKILLQKFIEIKKLELQHRKELQEYKEKAKRYDDIREALNYHSS